MNTLEKLERAIKKEVPETESHLDRPKDPSATWWLDLKRGSHSVTIEWKPNQGFGISSGDTGYGEGPDEVYSTVDEVTRRVLQLLREGMGTKPAPAVLRGRLRELRGLTQVQLAERLGIQQSTVSRLEKGDIQLTTLQRYIAALGGELKIQVIFPGDETVLLDPGL